jgi:hypothetical protein
MIDLLFAAHIYAAVPGKKLMDLEIRLGDRESHYLVTESPRRELALGFVNNARENRRTPIKPDEVKQLKKIILQMREPNHDLRRCPKQYIKVSFDGVNKAACENSKSPLAEKMRRFVNLMRYLI